MAVEFFAKPLVGTSTVLRYGPPDGTIATMWIDHEVFQVLREIIVGGLTVTPMAPCLAASLMLTYISGKAIPTGILERAALSRPWVNVAIFNAYLLAAVSVMKV